ncbi:MAG: MFS transporter [Ignavibacteriae bacterium]|nr:MAG: MFS transporter [Ignavibacteriota bacterium]
MKRDPYAALRNSEFRNFSVARILMVIATLMQSIIVGWQVYDITKDPLSLGLIGLAEVIPAISVSFYAGHLTDISDRKKIILFAYIMFSVCAAFLTIISYDLVPFIYNYKLHAIYAAIFVGGIARGFSMPSTFAFWSQLVDKEIFANAVTWNTSFWQFGAVTGPAIGGFVYAMIGFASSYFVITIVMAISILLLSSIKKKPIPVISEHSDIKERLMAGIKFVFNNKILLGAITLDLFAVLFGGATALLPIFSAEILNAGPQGLGMLRAAPSVGAVLMALFMTRRPPTENAGRNLLISVFGFGVSMIVFAVSKNFLLSLIALAVSGLFDSVSVVIRSTIMQLFTPDNMKGRVAAVNSIFIGSSNEIGAFESGVAAKLLGTVPSVILGGCMTLLVVGVMSIFSPKLRKLHLK